MAAAGRPAERAAGRRHAARAVTGRPRPPPRRRPRARAPDRRRPLRGPRRRRPARCSCAARRAAASSTATPRSSACAASTSCSPPATREPVVRAITAAAERHGVDGRDRRQRRLRRPRDRVPPGRRLHAAGAERRRRAARRAARPVALHARRARRLTGPRRGQRATRPAAGLRGWALRPRGHTARVRRRRRQRRRDREGLLHPQEHAALPPHTPDRDPRPRPRAPDVKFHLRMAFDLVELFAGMGIDLLPGSAAAASPEALWLTSAASGGGFAVRQLPARPREVAGVAVG